jgi:predicted dinucleotide-binding enzyme
VTKVGVLGTGQVGMTLAGRLGSLGYAVTSGARTADSASLQPAAQLPGVQTGSFADAADAADLVINATNGMHSQAALQMAGEEALAGKMSIWMRVTIAPGPGAPRFNWAINASDRQ